MRVRDAVLLFDFRNSNNKFVCPVRLADLFTEIDCNPKFVSFRFPSVCIFLLRFESCTSI